MNLMKTCAFYLFMVMPIVSFGQSVPNSSDYENNTLEYMNPSPNLVRERSAGAYGIKGSPYVFEDFKEGTLFYSNKMMVDGKNLNYDCHNNRLEYEEGTSIYVLNSKDVDYFQVLIGEEKVMLFKQVLIENLKQRIFLEVLYNEKSVLYKRYFKEFKEADYGGAYSQDTRYDEYFDRQSYYIKTANADLQQLKPKKKSVMELLEDKSVELEKYIKKEKINLKSEAGLVQLIQYYDGLE